MKHECIWIVKGVRLQFKNLHTLAVVVITCRSVFGLQALRDIVTVPVFGHLACPSCVVRLSIVESLH